MSRTIRRYISGTVRDGRQDWPTLIAHDDRATGFREHKRGRRVARVSLKSGPGDTLFSGKRRRYGERYGSYEL